MRCQSVITLFLVCVMYCLLLNMLDCMRHSPELLFLHQLKPTQSELPKVQRKERMYLDGF